MGKFVILVALCALCHAAPAPADIKETGLTRPSPINPAVLSDPKPAEKVVLLSAADHSQHREKRDETPPPKPHSVEASEKLHGPPRVEAPEKPDSVKAWEGLQHDPSRNIHHPTPLHAEHQPDSVKAREGLVKDPSKTNHHEPLPPLIDSQHREKRDETPPPKPHSVEASEKLHGPPSAEAPEKPDSVKAREGLQHDPSRNIHHPTPLHAEHQPDSVKAREGLHNHHKRDIPVPTEIKKAEPKEDKPHEADVNAEAAPHVESHGSTTPHGPLRHHPVPVAELFNKAKPSSSEESKESAEKEGSKA